MSDGKPWWMRTDKYCKSPTTTDSYRSDFYKDGKALTNKEVVDKLNWQDKKIKEQEKKIKLLTGFIGIVEGDEVFNVFDELNFIKKYLEFFIENDLEPECVECEGESLLEIRKRLELVIEPYYEAACMEGLDE